MIFKEVRPVLTESEFSKSDGQKKFFLFSALVFLSVAILMFNIGCATAPSYPQKGDKTACFHDFTDVYTKRIYPVLRNAPGVQALERNWRACPANVNCICYDLQYTRSLEELEMWINRQLPTSGAIPFRTVPRGYDWLEIYFDGGFE